MSKVGQLLAGTAALGAALAPEDAEAGTGQIVKALVRGADDIGLPAAAYRGGHTAPISPEYHAPLHDMTQTYPDDIYSPQAPRFYGHGDPSLDKESFDVINRVRGDENALVTIYRAVPTNAPDEILPGDWVTPNLEYAKLHGEGFDEYKILQGETNAGRLRTDGNSPHEFGYTGNALPTALGATAAVTGGTMAAMSPEVEEYLRDQSEATAAAQSFAQRRASKSAYWKQRRDELLGFVDRVGDAAMLTLDMPLRGYMGVSGAAGALAAGHGWDNAIQRGAQVASQPTDATAYEYGQITTDNASPYLPPEAAAGAGALVNAGSLLISPF